MNEPKRWVLPLLEDPDNPDNLIVQFTEEMLELAGWKSGDTLLWAIEDDRLILRKKEE